MTQAQLERQYQALYNANRNVIEHVLDGAVESFPELPVASELLIALVHTLLDAGFSATEIRDDVQFAISTHCVDEEQNAPTSGLLQ